MTRAESRRAAIIELVRTRPIATQNELQKLLRARGHSVNQATLSRDLAQLGARRAAAGTYEVDGTARDLGLGALASLVVGIHDAAALVVVHTRAGAAPAVAALLDQARLPSLLGTIAGDDTIFIVPERRTPPRTLASELERLLLAGG